MAKKVEVDGLSRGKDGIRTGGSKTFDKDGKFVSETKVTKQPATKKKPVAKKESGGES